MPSLLKKWKNVHIGVNESQEAYAAICNVVTPENVAQWQALEADAQARRWDEKEAMDIYDIQADKSKRFMHICRHTYIYDMLTIFFQNQVLPASSWC